MPILQVVRILAVNDHHTGWIVILRQGGSIRNTPRTSSRQLLELSDISAFFHEWLLLVLHCRAANKRLKPRARLGTPKLNSLVTECLAIHLINGGYLRAALPDVDHAELARGTGPEPDAWVSLIGAQQRGTMQIKATGPSTWQRASGGDATADVFLWLHCALLCTDARTIHAWTLRRPQGHLRAGLDWRSETQFAQFAHGTATCVVLRLDDILASHRAAS